MAFGTASERLAILITGDSAGAVRAIRQVGAEADKNLNKAKTASDKWASSLTKGGAAAVGFAAVVGVGLGKAAGAFENAQLSEIKLDTAMHNMPKLAGANRQAFEQLANKIQDHTKYANQDVVSMEAMLGQFGLTQAQILQLTPLVVDLAARMGIDLDTAAKAVGKAVDGNAGALRKLGVNLDLTAFKHDHYTAVVKAASAAQGFAEKQGETFSGQLAELKNHLGDVEERLGAGVVPALEHMLGPLKSATDYFHGLNPATTQAAGSILTYGTAAIGAAGVTSVIIGQVLKAKERFADLATTAPRASAALKVFGTIGTAFTIGAIIYEIGQAFEKNAPDVSRFTTALGALAAQEKATGVLSDQFGKNLGHIGEAIDVANYRHKSFLGQVGSDVTFKSPKVQFSDPHQAGLLSNDIKNTDAALAGLVQSGHADKAILAFRQIATAAHDQGVSLSDTRKAFPGYLGAMQDAQIGGLNLKHAVDQANGSLDQQTVSVHQLHDAHQKLQDALNATRDAQLASLTGAIDLVDKQDTLTSDYLTFVQASDAVAKSHGKNAQALADLHGASKTALRDVLDLAGGTVQQAQAQAKAQGRTLDANAANQLLIFSLEAEKQKYPQLSGAIQKYIDQLNSLNGKHVDTIVTINGKPVDVTTNRDIFQNPTGVAGTGHRAAGGSVGNNMPYVVGEKGPELFVPDSAGYIIPNGKFKTAATGAVVGQVTNWRAIFTDVKASFAAALNASGGPNTAAIDHLVKQFGLGLVTQIAQEVSSASINPIRQAIRDKNSAIIQAQADAIQKRADALGKIETAIGAISDSAKSIGDLNAARLARSQGGNVDDFRSAELQAIQQQQAKEDALRGLTAGGLKDFEALAKRTGLSKSEIANLEQGLPRIPGTAASGRGQGNVFNISVAVPPGASQIEFARAVQNVVVSLQHKGFKVA